jgi:hypothetical protein
MDTTSYKVNKQDSDQVLQDFKELFIFNFMLFKLFVLKT